MPAKRSRLSAAEVKEVLIRGRSLRLGPYRAKYLPGRVPPGLAVVVPKRMVRTAVARNRLRRRAYREAAPLLPTSGAAVLFVNA